MNSRLTRRQVTAWCLGASSVPAVMTCAGLPWQWVLAGCGGTAVFLWLIGAALRQTACGTGLCGVTCEAFGGAGGKAVLLLGVVWTVFAAADTAAACARAFPDEGLGVLAPLVLTALAGAAGAKGKQCAARCAAVLAPLLAGLYALIVLCAVPDVRPVWCGTWGSWRDCADAAAPMLLSVAGFYLYNSSSDKNSGAEEESGGRLAFGALAVLALAPALLAVITAGCLSPQLVQEEVFAFYALTKNMRLFSVIERFEPVLSASLVAGYFCILTLLVQAGTAQLCAAVPVWDEKRVAPALCAAAFGASFVAARVPPLVRQSGAAVFWGLIPALALLIVGIKKYEKSEKSS